MAWFQVVPRMPPMTTRTPVRTVEAMMPVEYVLSPGSEMSVNSSQVRPPPTAWGIRYARITICVTMTPMTRTDSDSNLRARKSGMERSPKRRSGAAMNSSTGRNPAANPVAYQAPSSPAA